MIQDQHQLARRGQIVSFSLRPVPPRVCVLDNKPHVRSFIAEALDELGFIVHQCGAAALAVVRVEVAPDLIVLGPLGEAGELAALLGKLAGFPGKVMLIGGHSAPSPMHTQELGERLGLAMLQPLGAPFRDGDLRANLGCFLPAVCTHIVAVASGVATHADFLTLRKLGFDLVQGPLFAKPLPAHKFAHSALARRFSALGIGEGRGGQLTL